VLFEQVFNCFGFDGKGNGFRAFVTVEDGWNQSGAAEGVSFAAFCPLLTFYCEFHFLTFC
jgi:hypothetical protein